MDKEFYTELTLKTKAPDDYGPNRITVRRTVWDSTMEDLLDMFRAACVGATFTEKGFRAGLMSYLEENYGISCEEPKKEE